MKRFTYVRCWLVVVLTLTLAVAASSKTSTTTTLDDLNSILVDDDVVDDDANEGGSVPPGDGIGLIEENPDYVERQIGHDDDDSGGGDDSESDDDDDGDSDKSVVKSTLNEALKKTNKRSREVVKLMKKNRAKITVALTVFAFRKEILQLVIFLARSQLPKSKTTAILKLILFVHFMRQLQTGIFSSTTMEWLSAFGDNNPAHLPPLQQHYTFERLNEYYVKDAMALRKAIECRHEGLKWPSSSSSTSVPPVGIVGSIFKSNDPPPTTQKSSLSNQTVVVVLDWSTGLDLDRIGDQVSFLLSEYRGLAMTTWTRGGPTNNGTMVVNNAVSDLEVVLMLNSPGGSAADFGLAAQHLLRLRDTPGITLTICVDKVAASGGYMLCCTASPGQLFASPFALLGSIGVIGQMINFQNLLEGWGVQPLVFRAGKDKSPVGFIGDISEEGKRTTQASLDATHKVFKDHIVKARPILKKDIDKIGNGEIYLGSDALAMKLIDGIMTADEYIQSKLQEGARVLKMIQNPRSIFLFGPRYAGDSIFETKRSFAVWGVQSAVQNFVKKLSLITLPKTMRMPSSIEQLVTKT